MQPSTEEIAKLAYQFYLEDGRPEGQAADHWARAEEFLRHPENHSNRNVLAVPSEPELTPALGEKGRELDRDLPSDPHTGREALHQRVELAIERKSRKKHLPALETALKHLKGIERIEPDAAAGRVTIHFDARRTNPAAIHEAVESHGYKPSGQ